MALHVTTEIGKSGIHEREKKHFTEKRGYYQAPLRGRLYIPPGLGDQPQWKPHAKHVNPRYTDSTGLDWDSRKRFLPPPFSKDDSDIQLYTKILYPWRSTCRSNSEWVFYPEKEGTAVGPKRTFEKDGQMVHLASQQSTNEITHTMLYGKGKRVGSIYETRGQIPWSSPGDKSYQAPEYSPNFHHYGSTLPLVNFGGGKVRKPDTFVPLQEVPTKKDNYKQKEKKRRRLLDIKIVKGLENWQASPVLEAPQIPDEKKLDKAMNLTIMF